VVPWVITNGAQSVEQVTVTATPFLFVTICEGGAPVFGLLRELGVDYSRRYGGVE
jgi:hypothetical protein